MTAGHIGLFIVCAFAVLWIAIKLMPPDVDDEADMGADSPTIKDKIRDGGLD